MPTRTRRWLAGAALGLLTLMPIRGLPQPASQDPRIASLVDEFIARREDPAAPLVPERSPQLFEADAAESARWATGFLTRIDAVDADRLAPDDWVTWAILRWEAEIARERGRFYWLDFPVTPYASPLRVIQSSFASAPLRSTEQRQRYLDGLRQLSIVAGAMESKLRGQAGRGVILPRAEIELVAPYLRSFAQPPERSPFGVAGPRLSTVADAARLPFAEAVAGTLTNVVNPAFERLAAYVETAYRGHADDAVGVSRYPAGSDYYRFLIRLHTGLDLTPEQIHQIGLDEVQRLERELDDVRRRVNFAGPLAEFRQFLKTDKRFFPSSPDEIGAALTKATARIEPAIAQWFAERPKAAYGARRLAAALEPSMTYGYYQVPTPADPTGNYMYNGSRLEERSILNAAALAYHELVPGHHFQIVLARENMRLPRFRRETMYTAFTEGWGEYASDLAGEMGMYEDPYDRAGRLSMDLFLTTRLVVDTGMNALGWPRERAIAFMREHTLESEAQIATETLRYSTDIPGQALAYKLGSRTIRQLRERMRARLGPAFDVRRFHQVVLASGAMPLGVLERHVERSLVVRPR